MTASPARSGHAVTWDEAIIFARLNSTFWAEHGRNPTDQEINGMVSSVKVIAQLIPAPTPNLQMKR